MTGNLDTTKGEQQCRRNHPHYSQKRRASRRGNILNQQIIALLSFYVRLILILCFFLTTSLSVSRIGYNNRMKHQVDPIGSISKSKSIFCIYIPPNSNSSVLTATHLLLQSNNEP